MLKRCFFESANFLGTRLLLQENWVVVEAALLLPAGDSLIDFNVRAVELPIIFALLYSRFWTLLALAFNAAELY